MEFIGLKNVLWEVGLLLQQKPFPHTLFTGPRGSGKTKLSQYIGAQAGVPFVEINAPALDKKKLYTTLLTLKPYSILFIDEIHRLHPAVEEILYQPTESRTLTVPFRNRLMTIKFIPFTLIGATTRPALLSKPMLSRFKIRIAIPRYSLRELARMIVTQYSMQIKEALDIAQYTLVPREALNLAFRVKSLNQPVNQALAFFGFKDGLSTQEQSYIKLIGTNAVSLTSLSGFLQLDEDTIQLLEERLMSLGIIEITGRGRQLSHKGLLKLQTL
jgi:Holliday junction DNA helicase RuvB